MKIGDNIHRFERCSMSLASAAGRPVDKDVLLRLLCDSLETWYNIFIRGTGDKIVHAFQEKNDLHSGRPCPPRGRGRGDRWNIHRSGCFRGFVCVDGGRRTVHDPAEVLALERG